MILKGKYFKMKKIKRIIAILVTILLVAQMNISAASNSISFLKSNEVDSNFGVTKINNSLVYTEKNGEGLTIRYLNTKTMKEIQKFNFEETSYISPVLSENYFIVNIQNGTDSKGLELYDRVVYNVKTGEKQVLKTKIPYNLCEGKIFNNTVFIFKDALYDFDRNYQLTEIETITDFLNQTNCTIKVDGRRFLFSPQNLILSEYPREDAQIEKYYLASDKYGFIYLREEAIYWQKADKSTVKVCPYQSLNDSSAMYQYYQYGTNSSGDFLYFINSKTSYVVLNIKAGKYQSFNMPGSFQGIGFDNKNRIALFYNFVKSAQQEWSTELTYLDEKGNTKSLIGDANGITFYKNYIVYNSGIVPMGMQDMWYTSVRVYNIKTGKTISLNGSMCSYSIYNGKITAYSEDNAGKGYLFDERKNAFVPLKNLSNRKYIGNGIYMNTQSEFVLFEDKKGTEIVRYWLTWQNHKVCVILPGSTQGFIYDGKSLKKIKLPDAKRYTKSNEIQVNDGYISYCYPVTAKGKTQTYVRIIKV